MNILKALYNLCTSPYAILALIGFVIISYFVIYLLTRSMLKPLKYLGFATIFSGCLSLSTKVLFNLNPHDMSYSKIERIIASKGLSVFTNYGIALLIIGLIALIIYYFVTIINMKNKKAVGESAC